MRFLTGLSERSRIQITGADLCRTLEQIRLKGIALYDIQWKDDLTVTFCCYRKYKKTIAFICRKNGDEMRCLEEKGPVSSVKKILTRPLLTAGIFLVFTLTVFLPTRVLFVVVEGNSTVPKCKILEAAEECGIRFGASRRHVRSEKMKNKLLEAVPELKWAGINTSGCSAVISVREHPVNTAETSYPGVSSIVASREGRIISCTVTKGNGLCVPGQVVQEGQLLISGYTDCGICIQVTDAEGEVFAETRHETRSVSPTQRLSRIRKGIITKRYSLILGKKRINLWKGSGISPITCGRMYEEYYITLPGGFRLPACLIVETLTAWELEQSNRLPVAMEYAMKEYARELVLKSGVASSILREDQKLTVVNDCYVLESSFFCSEMIGRVIKEEIGETNGKTD